MSISCVIDYPPLPDRHVTALRDILRVLRPSDWQCDVETFVQHMQDMSAFAHLYDDKLETALLAIRGYMTRLIPEGDRGLLCNVEFMRVSQTRTAVWIQERTVEDIINLLSFKAPHRKHQNTTPSTSS